MGKQPKKTALEHLTAIRDSRQRIVELAQKIVARITKSAEGGDGTALNIEQAEIALETAKISLAEAELALLKEQPSGS
ncbi:MAG: hypothetical protein JWO38_1662 [Gemmataceae bacterium]|nr:hypothetical protein [Gemmataceae bacterium]